MMVTQLFWHNELSKKLEFIWKVYTVLAALYSIVTLTTIAVYIHAAMG